MKENENKQESTGCKIIQDIIAVRPTNEEGSEWILTVGRHKASKKTFKTKEEAIEYASKPNWETIVAVVAEMIEISKEAEK